MVSFSQSIWLSRAAAFLLAAAATGSAAFWYLQAPARDGGAVITSAAAVMTTVDTSAVARALGAGGDAASQRASVVVESRYALLGVVAGERAGGAALIAIDGKPAKPYAIGAKVGEEWVVRTLQPRAAVLARSGQDGASVTQMELQLPPLNSGKNGP